MQLYAWLHPQTPDHADVLQKAALLGIERPISSDTPEEIHRIVDEPGEAGILLVRLPFEGIQPADMVASLKRALPDLPLVAWSESASAQEAARLSRLGFDDVLTDDLGVTGTKEILAHIHAQRVEKAAVPATGNQSGSGWRDLLVGESWSMQMIKHMIHLVSQRRCTVLIEGETGTGKEVAARALHLASPRSQGPMVSINCNAIPADLLESELFGHVRGAYTGAFNARIGRFEQANHGTLFLDEIGDLPLPLQAKLLRILQEREFQRVGSSETVKIDVRIIAATNADLHSLVREGKFRQDLFYRLNVASLTMPPLRNRREDIPMLAQHFVKKICAMEQIPAKVIPAEILEWLSGLEWPGNVRQLENAIESAIALGGDRAVLRLADFSSILCGTTRPNQSFSLPDEGIDFNRVMDTFERAMLEEALHLANGSKKRAAELLKLKRTTFMAKLSSLDISARSDAEEEELALKSFAQTA